MVSANHFFKLAPSTGLDILTRTNMYRQQIRFEIQSELVFADFKNRDYNPATMGNQKNAENKNLKD